MNVVATWRRRGEFDWLIALLLSWCIPLGLLVEWRVDYKVSLLLWAIPIGILLPRFISLTHRGSRRRKALYYTGAYILVLGTILDLGLGVWVLDFDPTEPDVYLGRLFGIPIEEFVFYATGGLAITLVYFWADEYWFALYNVRQHRRMAARSGKVIDLSWQTLTVAAVLIVAGILVKRLIGGPGFPVPIYYTFLVLIAFLPAIALYRTVRDLVNWRAFSFTALYVLLTSLLWETTLAIPKYWWRYQPEGMLGKNITVWTYRDTVRNVDAIFPIEALFVWVAVTFSVVFFYEAAKAFSYDDRGHSPT